MHGEVRAGAGVDHPPLRSVRGEKLCRGEQLGFREVRPLGHVCRSEARDSAGQVVEAGHVLVDERRIVPSVGDDDVDDSRQDRHVFAGARLQMDGGAGRGLGAARVDDDQLHAAFGGRS